MRRFVARYTPEAAMRIRRLHPHIKREIKEAVRELLKSPWSGHPLQFELAGLRSYRVRAHRLIYRINEEESRLEFYFVGQCSNVYEQLRALLLERGGS